MDIFKEIGYKQKGKDSLHNRQHSHNDCFEIIQTWTDDGYVLIKDNIYSMSFGGLYLINAIETHCTNPVNPDKYVRSKLVISSAYVIELARLTGIYDIIEDLFIKNGGSHFLFNREDVEFIDTVFHKMNKEYSENSSCKDAVISACVLELLTYISLSRNNLDVSNYTQIAMVINYINENINKNITIGDICRNVHISKYYVCHLFKKTTNMTIMQYILHRRISIAKKKLLYSSLPISEIAMHTGFSSFSFFSRTFKKSEGCTPKDFRKKPFISSSG